jgi:hypothetical protein
MQSYFDKSMWERDREKDREREGEGREREREREAERERIFQKDPCEDLETSLVDSSGNPDFIIDVWKGVSHV